MTDNRANKPSRKLQRRYVSAAGQLLKNLDDQLPQTAAVQREIAKAERIRQKMQK